MNMYESIREFINGMTPVANWPDIMWVTDRAVKQESRDWRLPLSACQAMGGSPGAMVPVLAAVACAHISLILIDDLLDADPRGEHHRLGMPLTANLATVFQQLALEALDKHKFADANAKMMAQYGLHDMMLKTALGQYLDFQNPIDEVAYWRIVQTKSSPFFGAAFYVGALAGGGSLDLAMQLKEFGLLYGEMIQIHDDLSDSLATPASPDWMQGRSPLPLLFAQVVDHPERERFAALRREIPDPEALAEAQSILIRCGALSYSVYELMNRHKRGLELLDTLSVKETVGLEKLLDDQMVPVRRLFASLGEKS
jgi:geranylgeranyl pyrophosphate synthase